MTQTHNTQLIRIRRYHICVMCINGKNNKNKKNVSYKKKTFINQQLCLHTIFLCAHSPQLLNNVRSFSVIIKYDVSCALEILVLVLVYLTAINNFIADVLVYNITKCYVNRSNLTKNNVSNLNLSLRILLKRKTVPRCLLHNL